MPGEKIPRGGHSPGVALARGSLVNLAATLVANLRGLFTFLVARLLGQAALGTFALAFSSIDLLSKVGTFGLDGATTAQVARAEAVGDRDTSRRLLRTALTWGLGLSLLTAIVGVVGLRWWQDQAQTSTEVVRSMRVMMLALPGIMLYRVATGFSRGMRVMRHDLYSRGLTESLVTILALLLAIALGFRLMAPVAAVVAGTCASGLVALHLARQLAPAASPASGAPLTGPLLRMAAPLAGTNLLNALTLRMDVLMLGLFIGRVEGITIERIGVFSAAVDLAGMMRKLRQVFDPIFMPVVAGQLAVGDRAGATASFVQLGRWVLGVQLFLLGIMWAGGGLLLSLLGPGFREGALWVAVLAVAHATNSFVGLGETLIMVQRPTLNTVNSAVTAMVQATVGLVLIPRWGPLGAAISTVAAYATQGSLRFVELHALLGWRFAWGAFRTPCVAFLVGLVPGLALRAWLGPVAGELAGMAVFTTAYVLTWRSLGLDEADRMVLAALRRRPREEGAA